MLGLRQIGKVDEMAPPIDSGMRRRYDDLETEWTGYAAERDRILGEALGAFNALFEQHQIPAVRAPEDKEPEVEAGEEAKG